MHRALLGFALLLWFYGLAVCQNPSGFAQSSGMDISSPYRVYHDPTLPPFLDTSGYTKVPCTLEAGRNAVVIAVGQSNLTNVVVGTPYVVTSSNNQHFNIYDQNCY